MNNHVYCKKHLLLNTIQNSGTFNELAKNKYFLIKKKVINSNLDNESLFFVKLTID